MLYIDEELNRINKKKTNQKMATNQQLSSKAKHPRQNMTLCRASGGNAAEVVSQRITSASNSEPNWPTHSLRPKCRSGVLKRCPNKNHYMLATSSWPAYMRMFDSVVYLKIYPKASNQRTNPRNEVPHSNAKGTASDRIVLKLSRKNSCDGELPWWAPSPSRRQDA